MAIHPTVDHSDTEPATRATILSRSAMVALSRVLNALRDGWLLERRLGHVARMIAEEARAQRLSVEQMVSALTEEWPRVVEIRRVPNDANLRMLVDRLMELCVLEFEEG